MWSTGYKEQSEKVVQNEKLNKTATLIFNPISVAKIRHDCRHSNLNIKLTESLENTKLRSHKIMTQILLCIAWDSDFVI